MEYYISLIVGIMSLLIQAFVVYYGVKLYEVIGKTKYWTCAWKFYIIANSILLLRHVVSFLTVLFVLCPSSMLRYVVFEELLAIGVSVLLLLFGAKLAELFGTYVFKSDTRGN
jgi:hypothetical protein